MWGGCEAWGLGVWGVRETEARVCGAGVGRGGLGCGVCERERHVCVERVLTARTGRRNLEMYFSRPRRIVGLLEPRFAGPPRNAAPKTTTH